MTANYFDYMLSQANSPVINHHPVFKSFACWQGEVKAGFYTDFLGTITRAEYFSLMSSPEYGKTRFVQSDYPPFDEEYFEWVDLLEAVTGAKDRFTMIELGAGWGRWLCRAALALKQRDSRLPYHLVGVEAEPTHYRWMKEHLQDNNVNLSWCELIEAAVSDKEGVCRFYTGDAYTWYGQRMASRIEHDGRIREVKSVSLGGILKDLDGVDLIDLDIQGSELSVLSAVPANMWDKVKRVHIGTHSQKAERGIRKLFANLGWYKRYDFPANNVLFTHYGWISFQDGVQSWVNPEYIKSDDFEFKGTTPKLSQHTSCPDGKWSYIYDEEVLNSISASALPETKLGYDSRHRFRLSSI